MGLPVRVATSAYYALSVVVGHFAVSGVGIWTDSAVGVGRVAIFNALKGMPPPLPPCERAHLHTRAPDEIQINPPRSANASLLHWFTLTYFRCNSS